MHEQGFLFCFVFLAAETLSKTWILDLLKKKEAICLGAGAWICRGKQRAVRDYAKVRLSRDKQDSEVVNGDRGEGQERGAERKDKEWFMFTETLNVTYSFFVGFFDVLFSFLTSVLKHRQHSKHQQGKNLPRGMLSGFLDSNSRPPPALLVLTSVSIRTIMVFPLFQPIPLSWRNPKAGCESGSSLC